MEIKELTEVEELLQEQLNPEVGNVLAAQLTQIEAWGGRVSKLAAEAKSTLAQMRDKYRMPKSPGTTDFDRGIMLEAAVRDFDARYDYLQEIQEAIKRRITLGQSLLRSLRTEVESLGR